MSSVFRRRNRRWADWQVISRFELSSSEFSNRSAPATQLRAATVRRLVVEVTPDSQTRYGPHSLVDVEFRQLTQPQGTQ